MHEVSVAARMLEIALDAAGKNGGGRIQSARLLLGGLTCVEPDTLRFAFEVAARGTAADGCRLEIVRVEPRLRCRACGREFSGELLDPCPGCQAVGGETLQGRELRLDSIDMADDGAA